MSKPEDTVIDSDLGNVNGAGHETKDANIKSLVLSGIGLFIITGIVLVIIVVLIDFFEAQKIKNENSPHPLAVRAEGPPEPRLQVTPDKDWQIFRAREDSILNSYGWIQKEVGVLRLPVERAMELILETGLPSRDKITNDAME